MPIHTGPCGLFESQFLHRNITLFYGGIVREEPPLQPNVSDVFPFNEPWPPEGRSGRSTYITSIQPGGYPGSNLHPRVYGVAEFPEGCFTTAAKCMFVTIEPRKRYGTFKPQACVLCHHATKVLELNLEGYSEGPLKRGFIFSSRKIRKGEGGRTRNLKFDS